MSRRNEYRLEVQYEYQLLPEDTSFEGNAKVDLEQEDWIRRQLARGNDAAWCVAHPIAHLTFSTTNGVLSQDSVGDAYLGACSYESDDDLWQSMHLDYDLLAEARHDAARDMRHVLSSGRLKAFERLFAELDRREELGRLYARQARAERVMKKDPEWAQRELVAVDEALEKLR